MPNPFYAMDTCFYHSLGSYPFAVRCEMLRELGYDGTYLTLWNEQAWQDLDALADVHKRYGLSMASVYATLDVAGEDKHEGNARIVAMLERLEGCRTLELSVRSSDATLRPSDPRADEAMAPWLGKLLRVAAARGITIALYPHMNFWVERIEDAVRLCKRIEHPNLGVAFSSFHWYAVDGKNLPGRLEMAAPYLHRVNICGSRPNAKGMAMPCSIEPLDEGELDNFALLGLLRKIGYDGPVGLQGYSNGGDAYAKLRRSLEAYRDMHHRLDVHRDWAELQWK